MPKISGYGVTTATVITKSNTDLILLLLKQGRILSTAVVQVITAIAVEI